MSIRWDPLLTRSIAAELDSRLRRWRLRAVRLDRGTRDAALLFREATLLWRLHPSRGSVEVLRPSEPDAADVALPARIPRVEAATDERILTFHLIRVRGRSRKLRFIVELLGNQWNALLVDDAHGRITHLLRPRPAGARLAVGAPYAPPTPLEREGADGVLTAARWREIQGTGAAAERARRLVRRLAYTSTLNAEALARATAPEPIPDSTAVPGQDAGYRWWRNAVAGRAMRPVLLHTARGLQPYPLPLPGMTWDPAESVLEAISRAVRHGPDGLRDADSPDDGILLPPALLRRLERAIAVARSRVGALERQLREQEDPDASRSAADLILARYARIPRGAREVTLEDFDGNPRRIPLDPACSPRENAERYYRRARRAARARQRLPDILERARASLTALQRLRARAGAGSVGPEEIARVLPVEAERNGGQSGPGLPYRSFRSSGGLEIRVGRNARSNDDLTFHHSAPDDVWLHARHTGGAHVILRWGRRETPPARDLREAAVLAALHSSARTSGRVPVDWTARKYVRKPRGAAPGSVVPERVRTLFVAPDPDVARRLAVNADPSPS